jgi:hypothetical protein
MIWGAALPLFGHRPMDANPALGVVADVGVAFGEVSLSAGVLLVDAELFRVGEDVGRPSGGGDGGNGLWRSETAGRATVHRTSGQ